MHLDLPATNQFIQLWNMDLCGKSVDTFLLIQNCKFIYFFEHAFSSCGQSSSSQQRMTDLEWYKQQLSSLRRLIMFRSIPVTRGRGYCIKLLLEGPLKGTRTIYRSKNIQLFTDTIHVMYLEENRKMNYFKTTMMKIHHLVTAL